MEYQTLLKEGGVYRYLATALKQVLKSKKENEELKEVVAEQKKQIKHQLFHLERFAPWGLEKKTPKEYEDYIAYLLSENCKNLNRAYKREQELKALDTVVREINREITLRKEETERVNRLLSYIGNYRYYDIVTRLDNTVEGKSTLEISNFLVNHYYNVWSVRDHKCNLPFASHVLKAAKLLRKYHKMEDKAELPEEHEVVNFRKKQPELKLMTGGRGGGRINNWLKDHEDLGAGAVFICKKMGDTEWLGYQFEIDWKGNRAALLTATVPTKAELVVDMKSFSMTHELLEIQRVGYDKQSD